MHTYIFYPIILFIWSSLRKKNIQNFDNYYPTVSVVIAVYNEESVLRAKLENFSTYDYPEDKIEFLLGSDGSTDRTNEILQQSTIKNLRFYSFPQRRGKASVLNDLIPLAKGEIIVFSDANTFYIADTIQKLIKNFSHSNVGATCGELILKSNFKTSGGRGEYVYWSFENMLKKMESEIKTIAGATGAIYAVRKNLITPLPTEKVIMDDFLIPLEVVRTGYDVKYIPDAIAYEKPSDSIRGEFRRKVRIGAANFYGISNFPDLLHFKKGFIAFALWSHKILRWCVPFFLLLCIFSSIFLSLHSKLYFYFFYGEIVFLCLSLFGFLSEKIKLNIRLLSMPYYFLAMNTALLVGFFKFLFGKQQATWDVQR